MKKDLLHFVYEDGLRVRTIVEDDQLWFVAVDVCKILGHSNPTVAVMRLDDDEKGVRKVYTPGGTQELIVVNEPGLYSLVLRSNKPEAKSFKRWITHEVIPSIRKTGSYTMQQPQSIEDLIILQAQSMKELRSKVDSLSEQLQVTQHRIDNLDHVDVIGDKQQRLVAMVKKVAKQNGWTFRKAWQEFTNSFNTAYRTNLVQRIEHYKEKHGLQELSRPQYLSIVGELDDAIRVADKMLNLVGV